MSYVDAFLNERPKAAYDILSSRLKDGKVLFEEISEWFRERAQIEEAYSKSLSKLGSKRLGQESNLGTFSKVWSTVIEETKEVAELHSELSKVIAEKIAKPLKEHVVEDELWSHIKSHELPIAKIVKEYDERMLKVARAKKVAEKEKTVGKKATTSIIKTLTKAKEPKLDDSQRALDETIHKWTSEAPALIEKYHQIDQKRLETLKQHMGTFANGVIELCQNHLRIGEVTSKSVEAFDVQQEMEEFCSTKKLGIEPLASPSELSLGYHASNASKSSITDAQSVKTTHTDTSATNGEVANGASRAPTIVVDEEGYSVPPAENSMWNQPPDSPTEEPDTPENIEDPEEPDTPRMKIDIKESAITEEPEEADRALSRVSTTLRLKNTVKQTTRGRRETKRRVSTIDWESNSTDSFPSSPSSMYFEGGKSEFPFNSANSLRGFNSSLSPRADALNARFSVINNPAFFMSEQPLQVRVTENLNVLLLPTGEISKVFITGDIAVRGSYSDESPLKLVVKGYEELEKKVLNYKHVKADAEEGVYSLDNLSQLNNQEGALVLKYQTKIDPNSLGKYVPLLLKSAWKCEENLTSLVVQYKPNPDFQTETGEWSLKNLSFVLPVVNTINVQSKPTGVWSNEKQRLLWRMNDLNSDEDEHKLLARFETTAKGAPTSIAAKFSYNGASVSGLNVQLKSSSNQIFVQTEYRTNTGKYILTP
ncbi:FCH-domain-containing protein [Basidiobolus meristosporus CBS 931.73]|uniref:FCH-domain-containing protein n=1 Tax=Basidiobolus meristosporus CBS 931.73 TaxID=1314790 RepID=A0A1Y1YJT2_9FUNG|nr:FCH-domain-containing protein [Basidiobolus meristosporus CBS 931.73]|eukprot:ORX98270.1 FCH-domain-containing protein [Basidiobolus meristosporus CBS 931.73]